MWDRLRRRWRGEMARRFARSLGPVMLGGPTISFTFDDFLHSAATTGAALLERHGARGTFYVNGATLGGRGELGAVGDAALLRRVHAAGHEIGCHTHAHLDLFTVDSATIEADLDRNAACLDALLGPARRSFAYPYGGAPLRAKRICARRFLGARWVAGGVNGTSLDLALIGAQALETARDDKPLLAALIAQVARDGGWLVFYAHDVAEAPGPYGVTPGDLDWCITEARKAGCDIRTTAEVLGG